MRVRPPLQRAVPVHRQFRAQHHGGVDPQQCRRGPLPSVQRRLAPDRHGESAGAGTAALGPFAHDGTRQQGLGSIRQPGAPQLDFVITVCDNAAGEVCPVWPGQPMTAHWGMPDPAAVRGNDDDRRKAFADASHLLRNRIRSSRACRWRSSTGCRSRSDSMTSDAQRNDRYRSGAPSAAPCTRLVRALADLVGRTVHRRGHRVRPTGAGTVSRARSARNRARQCACRPADLADDRADAAEDRLRRTPSGRRACARHWRHALHQLGGEALLHGAARVAVRPPRVCVVRCRRTSTTAMLPG